MSARAAAADRCAESMDVAESMEAATSVEALAEAVAARVVERLRGQVASPLAGWLDASEVARLLSVSRDYVYAHADELGALRLPGALLRFDAAVIAELLSPRCRSERSEQSESPAPAEVRAARRRPSTGAAPDLLPIKGRSAA